jgi:Fe-S cluster biogenesis protein NfuA
VSETSPQELVAEVERRLDRVQAIDDEEAIAVARALLELYGAGLERIVEAVAARDHDGDLARALGDDELVSHLLMLHGLHPMPVGERVAAALNDVRPYLDSHGGDVELLAIDDSTVRLRLHGSCSGCPSSAVTLKLAIEDAIHRAAPEIEDVIAVDEEAPPLLQIELAPGMASSASAEA